MLRRKTSPRPLPLNDQKGCPLIFVFLNGFWVSFDRGLIVTPKLSLLMLTWSAAKYGDVECKGSLFVEVTPDGCAQAGDQMNDTSQDTGRGKGWKGKLFPFCAEKYWCTRPWQHLGQGNPFMRSGCSISIQNCHCIKLSPGWSQISINLSIYSSMLLAVALCESTGCRQDHLQQEEEREEALRWDLMRFPDICALVEML